MTVTMESVSVAPLSLEDRQAILQQQVVAHAAKGWSVLSQTQTQASLTKGKDTSHLLHLVLSVVTLGLWIPVWIVVTIAAGKKTRLVTVNEQGSVIVA